MPDMLWPDRSKILCVSKYEIPALLSKFEAELYKELETNLFPYNENASDKIVSFEYKGINTYDSLYFIQDFLEPCVTVTWKETGNVVDDFTLCVVFNAYTSQLNQCPDYMEYSADEFAEDFTSFKRVEQADIIAEHFDEKTFSDYIRAIPYDEDEQMAWLPVVFRFGNDEVIEQAINFIFDNEELIFHGFTKEEFVGALLSLSDSDYAALTREAMLYSLDKDCDDYEIHKKSDDTDIYSSLDYEDIDFGEILSFD